ncbi:GNAT family N-acetyltransferase [Campylobacter sp. US33a]|nr:GNAT family N-acetyltransferase [Campylobacter sp. US33a]
MRIRHFKCLSSELKNALIELWEQSVRASHHFLTEEDISKIKQYLNGDEAFIRIEFLFIYENNEFVGFLGFCQTSIQMLFIHPNFFRKNYGTSLVNFAITHFELDKIEVNLDNEKALKFYEKLGFQIYDRYVDEFGFVLLKMKR